MERKVVIEMEKKVTTDCPAKPYISVLYQKQDLRQLNLSWRPVGTRTRQRQIKSVLTPDMLGAVDSVWKPLVWFIWAREDDQIQPWAVVNACNKTRI